jgi:hypothetical protein
MMMLLVVTNSEQGPSVRATDSASFSAGLDASMIFGNACLMPGTEQSGGVASIADSAITKNVLGGDVPHMRSLMDPYPSFNGVVVDPENNLALLSDANRKSLLIYDRASGIKSAKETTPLRQIAGPDTLGGFFAGMIADASRREVYAVNNDIEDSMVVFSYDDAGNAKPKRVLGVSHGAWGLSLSKVRDEIAMTIQDFSVNAVMIYRREANGLEAPLRSISGPRTELADPHGIYFDDAHQEIIVANWGSWNVPLGSWFPPPQPTPPRDLPGGRFNLPSVTVYPAKAQGDVVPVRKIQGAATQLNWPTGVDLDPLNNEIFVANNGDNSVLIFPQSGSGDLKPSRIVRGPRTGINRPMAVAVDRKNNELWVANFGDHTALVFDLKGTGNIAPKRVIRNAPAGTPTGGFGNPETVAYDPKREEILVSN